MIGLITYIAGILLTSLAYIDFKGRWENKKNVITLIFISILAVFTIILIIYIDSDKINSDLCEKFNICLKNNSEILENQYINNAKKYIESGEFSLAEKELDKISDKNLKEDVNYLRNEIVKGKKQKFLKKIGDYIANKQYTNAINYIDTLDEKYKTMSEITLKKEEVVELYRNSVLNEAEKFFITQGYEKAIQHLNTSLKYLPDDKVIKKAIDDYNSYKPVALSSLEPYYTKSSMFSLGYYESNNGKDNLGNEYVDVIGGDWENKYKIDGKYTELKGIFYYRYEYRNLSSDKLFDTSGEISVYNGDKIIESISIEPGEKPKEFSIDISQVNDLKIILDTSDMTLGGSICYAEIANVMLYK